MSLTHIYAHSRIQNMATTNELRVNIFFSLLFYFTKYNNMVVKSHIIKKKNRSFIDVIFNMLISLTFNDNLISIYKHC